MYPFPGKECITTAVTKSEWLASKLLADSKGSPKRKQEGAELVSLTSFKYSLALERKTQTLRLHLQRTQGSTNFAFCHKSTRCSVVSRGA
jgi:hypothetical protein